MLVFEGLLNEWDKIWNDLIGIWLESLVHGYTIRANSGFLLKELKSIFKSACIS